MELRNKKAVVLCALCFVESTKCPSLFVTQALIPKSVITVAASLSLLLWFAVQKCMLHEQGILKLGKRKREVAPPVHHKTHNPAHVKKFEGPLILNEEDLSTVLLKSMRHMVNVLKCS